MSKLTSSIKPEIHNVSLRCQKDDRATTQITCRKIFCEDRMCNSEDWHTHTHARTHTQTRSSQYSCRGGVKRHLGQTWNWDIGSPGHLSRPGHRVIILTLCETRVFPVFEKNAQNAKRTFEMLKWQKSLSGVCCWTEITGFQCNELLLLPVIIKSFLAREYFFVTSMTSLLDIYT